MGDTTKTPDVYTGLDAGLGSLLDRASANANESRKVYLTRIVKGHIKSVVQDGTLEIRTPEEAKAMDLTDAEQKELAKKAAQARLKVLQAEVEALQKQI